MANAEIGMSDSLPKLIESLIRGDADAYSELNTQQGLEGIALALESVPEEKRLEIWAQIPEQDQVEVLVAMHGDPRKLILKKLNDSQLDALFTRLDSEDLIELSESLPEWLVDRAIQRLDDNQKILYEQAQQFTKDQTGHWANHQVIVVPQNTRIRDVRRLFRKPLPVYTEIAYLIDRTGRLTGCVPMVTLFNTPDHIYVSEIKVEGFQAIPANSIVEDAAELVARSGRAALPVVGEDGIFLGRLDIGSALDILQQQSEEKLMASAGLDADADLFAPVGKSAKARALWLGINFLTALLASWFIGLFEATLEQVVALAVLMPIVASMGGIAGSQTSTLIVRGLALGQINKHNFMALMIKELKVGLINGVIWSLVIGIIAVAWFSNSVIGLVIGVAIIINTLSAIVSGICIPMVLDKLKIDPALAASVVLTTVTDIVGFVAFLGLGTLLLT